MVEEATTDPIRRDVVAGAAALSFTAAVGAAIARSGARASATTATRERAARVRPTTTAAPDAGGAVGPETTPAPSGTAASPTTSAPAAASSTTAAEPTTPVLTPAQREHHVASRLTFGPTSELLDHVNDVGIDAFVAEQLDPATIEDPECDALLSKLDTLGDSAAQIERCESGLLGLGLLARPSGTALREVRLAALVRAIHSRRQLFEVVVQFWTDHFNIYPGKEHDLRFEKPVDDREVIRHHALGRFSDLLLASARSPAMLRYLDNFRNEAEDPNENYARELLELHTLGVGNFGESDVEATARVLSGWTITRDHHFRFDPHRHSPSPATVAGWSTTGTSGPDAVQDGESLLVHLANHPATAHHVAIRLARWFVRDDPPAGLVDGLARVYLDHDTEIRPVLEALFASTEFYDGHREKFRRPFDFVAAMMRLLDGRVDTSNRHTARATGRLLTTMGHQVFDWPAPDGYPQTTRAWLAPNDVLSRWNAAQQVTHRLVPGLIVDLDAVVGSTDGRTVGEVADRVMAATLLPDPPGSARDAVVSVAGGDAGAPFTDGLRPRLATMVSVALSAEEVQYR